MLKTFQELHKKPSVERYVLRFYAHIEIVAVFLIVNFGFGVITRHPELGFETTYSGKYSYKTPGASCAAQGHQKQPEII